MTARGALLVAALGASLLGCPSAPDDPQPPEPAGEATLPPPPPPARFADPTDAQRELQEQGPPARAALAATGPMSRARFDALLDETRDALDDGRLAAAEATIDVLRREAPPSGHVEVLGARLDLASGKIDDAVDALVRAMRIDDQRIDAMLALVAIYRDRDQDREAAEVLLRLERSAERMGHVLASDAPLNDKRRAIANLAIGVPNGPAARALLRALESDEFRVRVAALEALVDVATDDVAPRIRRALDADPSGRYATLYRAVLDAIEARAPGAP